MSGNSKRSSILGMGIFCLFACAPVPHTAAPITNSEARTQGATLATACNGRDGWSDAAPPARIFGNTYYVGTCGISVLLVTSDEGHVLIDGATAEAVPSILANIRALGFDPRDVKYIVGSHEHVDHMGGFPLLQEATGARVMVSGPALPVVATGQVAADDPQFGIIPNMQPMALYGTIGFSEEVQSVELPLELTRSVPLTAHATPGHTSGGTSWTWQSCEELNCATFAYVDSMTAMSRDGYRFTDHPERVAPFRETFQRVSRLPCDILVTPHPGFSNLFERMRGAEPLIDRDACRRLVHAMRVRLDARLASEAGQ